MGKVKRVFSPDNLRAAIEERMKFQADAFKSYTGETIDTEAGQYKMQNGNMHACFAYGQWQGMAWLKDEFGL